MKTKLIRQIKFNQFDKIYMDKTVDLLVDICNIMIDETNIDFDDFAHNIDNLNIDMWDADSGEIISNYSELQNCAIILTNLLEYIEENKNRDINIECSDIDITA